MYTIKLFSIYSKILKVMFSSSSYGVFCSIGLWLQDTCSTEFQTRGVSMNTGGGRYPYAVGGRVVYAFVGVHEVPVGVGLGRGPWECGCAGSDEVAADVGLGGSGGGSCPSSGRD